MRLLLAVIFTFLSFGAMAAQTSTAVFAGGCFWCMEQAFTELKGVSKVSAGYTGGTVANPTYEQVSSGTTGHVEAVQVEYDPSVVSYEKLLEWFWDNVDPTDPNGQFCDKGTQYAAGIFYTTDEQKVAAEKSFEEMKKKISDTLTAKIEKAGPFYLAEEYHQGYFRKNALKYNLYKNSCGRRERLKELKKERQ